MKTLNFKLNFTYSRIPAVIAVRCSLAWLLVAGFFIFNCSAQASERMAAQLLLLPDANEIQELELRSDKGRGIDVEVSSKKLTVPYKIRVEENWVIGETIRGEDGKLAFHEYGKCKALTSSNKQLLILHRKGPENKDGFEITAYDNKTTSFAGGDYLLINLSKFDVGGALGEATLDVKANQSTIIKTEPDEEKKLCHVKFNYLKENGKLKEFYATNWPLDANTRSLVFFFNPPESKRMKMHFLQDATKD